MEYRFNNNWYALKCINGFYFSSGAIISAAFNSMTQIISTMIFPKIVMKFSENNPKEKSTEVMIKISRLQAFIAFYILGGYLVVGKFL